MKPIKIRNSNHVDLHRTFVGQLHGGSRGFADAMALETFSNDLSPCIKTMDGFTLIIEIQ